MYGYDSHEAIHQEGKRGRAVARFVSWQGLPCPCLPASPRCGGYEVATEFPWTPPPTTKRRRNRAPLSLRSPVTRADAGFLFSWESRNKAGRRLAGRSLIAQRRAITHRRTHVHTHTHWRLNASRPNADAVCQNGPVGYEVVWKTPSAVRHAVGQQQTMRRRHVQRVPAPRWRRL